jgi:zinc/manganese transport system substrate-binding protein
MRRGALAAVVVVAGLGLGGCSAPSGSDRPQVVVTTNILGDVVENVLGDQVEVTTLMPPNADPHSSQISVQQAAMMSDADLIVSNGLGLEEGLQQHLDRAVDAGAPVLVAGSVQKCGSGAPSASPDA